ncbi:class I SAM-dependent DNA methyltransferase [Ferviditalea candida]|uniref:Class I SAM-dependent methyltransferase n=1 Tax=Ferviditalea candida TaxID=3108399 RepID=A0ABU5ZI25_9BACL|nr:class I SAM-dependent methyltransferase [Paenibacillaceae bacterium T2]
MEGMPYPAWLHFAETCWGMHGKPGSVAELGCGTGLIAIPLAQTGLHVFGIDLSDEMLSVASSKLEELRRRQPDALPGSVSWLQQDMRSWELPHPVDSVISFCDSLNYLLEEEEIERTFRQTWNALEDGGTFMFDVHTRHQLRTYAEEQPYFLDEEDIAYIWTCEWDEARCEIEHDLTLFIRERQSEAGFRRVREVHRQRAYDTDWLKAALFKAGFSSVDAYADFKLQPLTPVTQRAFFVAVK